MKSSMCTKSDLEVSFLESLKRVMIRKNRTVLFLLVINIISHFGFNANIDLNLTSAEGGMILQFIILTKTNER